MTLHSSADFPLIPQQPTHDDATCSTVPPPTIPRLALAHIQSHRGILDGAWWPRSWDAAAEFPGLIHALSVHFGPVRAILANREAWDSQIRRFVFDGKDVRMCWFSSLGPAALAAMTHRGDQYELLVVPPETAAGTAAAAMIAAADPADFHQAGHVLKRAARVEWDHQGKEL